MRGPVLRRRYASTSRYCCQVYGELLSSGAKWVAAPSGICTGSIPCPISANARTLAAVSQNRGTPGDASRRSSPIDPSANQGRCFHAVRTLPAITARLIDQISQSGCARYAWRRDEGADTPGPATTSEPRAVPSDEPRMKPQAQPQARGRIPARFANYLAGQSMSILGWPEIGHSGLDSPAAAPAQNRQAVLARPAERSPRPLPGTWLQPTQAARDFAPGADQRRA